MKFLRTSNILTEKFTPKNILKHLYIEDDPKELTSKQVMVQCGKALLS